MTELREHMVTDMARHLATDLRRIVTRHAKIYATTLTPSEGASIIATALASTNRSMIGACLCLSESAEERETVFAQLTAHLHDRNLETRESLLAEVASSLSVAEAQA